jgi:N-acetylglucosamine kinase-like BadF-type ATPase
LNTTTVGTTTYRGSYLLADDIIDNSATFSQTDNVPAFSATNAFNITATMAITNITQAAVAVVTVADTSPLTEGAVVSITGVIGMTQVNDIEFTISIINSTTLQLVSVDSTGYTAYTSGGSITYAVTST